jgi:hypothetical protein
VESVVVAQLGVAVRVVVVQSGEANDSEAAECLVHLMEVVATVVVVATTDDELVVAFAVLADRTARQDRDGFILRCL